MIALRSGVRAALERHAADARPRECCGFLLGTRDGEDRVALEARRAENRRADEPNLGFLIAPEDYLAAQLEAERRGWDVVGFYHSHPGGRARPSERDRSHALPGCSYVIMGLPAAPPGMSAAQARTGNRREGFAATEMRAWILAPDHARFVPEELVDDDTRKNPPGRRNRSAAPGESRHASPEGLSTEERVRYSRHMLIPEVGEAGQRRLREASVLLVGMGGLGSPAALYLAAAGVGRLGLVDFDRVDATNLQRQIIHHTDDVGRPKLDSARERIAAINPHVRVETHDLRLTAGNALEVMEPYEVVVDGTDNFATRYLVNDACVLSGKPNVYGSIFRFEGQVAVFDARRGPCYRCLYPEPPPPGSVPSCAEGGVLGVLPGIVGSLQAAETIKLLLGIGDPLAGRLLLFDALEMRFRELRLDKDPACPVCGERPTVTGLIDYDVFCGSAAETGGPVPEITARELARALDEVTLIDVREPFETEIASIPGARLIPLGELPDRMDELDRDADLVMQCRSGVRSATATRLLLRAGFRRVRNLEGGILAWADDVDPTVTRY